MLQEPALSRDNTHLVTVWLDAATGVEAVEDIPAEAAIEPAAAPIDEPAKIDEDEALRRAGVDLALEDKRLMTTLLVRAATAGRIYTPAIDGVGPERMLRLVNQMIGEGTLERALSCARDTGPVPRVTLTAQGLRDYGRIVGPGGPAEMLHAQPQLRRANPFLDGRSVALVWKRRVGPAADVVAQTPTSAAAFTAPAAGVSPSV